MKHCPLDVLYVLRLAYDRSLGSAMARQELNYLETHPFVVNFVVPSTEAKERFANLPVLPKGDLVRDAQIIYEPTDVVSELHDKVILATRGDKHSRRRLILWPDTSGRIHLAGYLWPDTFVWIDLAGYIWPDTGVSPRWYVDKKTILVEFARRQF